MTRILVADDDPSVRSAIRRTLEAEGYEGGGQRVP